jgi:hypothetical protein
VAEDLGLQRVEALQAVGDAFEDEREVGGAVGAHKVGEVGGFGPMAD